MINKVIVKYMKYLYKGIWLITSIPSFILIGVTYVINLNKDDDEIGSLYQDLKPYYKKYKTQLKDYFLQKIDNMYTKLTLVSRRKPKFTSFEEVEACLRNIGTMKFVDTAANRFVHDPSDSLYEFVEYVFESNRVILTKRISKRFGVEVKTANSDVNRGTNRSFIDLYLICIHYRPETTVKELYSVLAKLNENDNGMTNMICSTINKHVYNRRGVRGGALTTGYIMPGVLKEPIVDELDVSMSYTVLDDNRTVKIKYTIGDETVDSSYAG